MKKLLVLVVMASLAVVANGVLDLRISVGGDTAITEITIAPSDWLVLDITQVGNFIQPADSGAFALICDVAFGAITQGSGVVTAAAPSAASFDNDPANWGDLAEMFGNPGVYGTLASWTTGSFAGGKYFDEIAFHCQGPGDAIVQLVWTYDFATYTVVDTLTVHQIPEPATIALLCLGGLLLRKKR